MRIMDKSRAEINNFERLNGITARCEFACGKLEEDGVLHWASGEMRLLRIECMFRQRKFLSAVKKFI